MITGENNLCRQREASIVEVGKCLDGFSSSFSAIGKDCRWKKAECRAFYLSSTDKSCLHVSALNLHLQAHKQARTVCDST